MEVAARDLSYYNWSLRTIYGSYSWFPGPFVALQMVPPNQLWHHGWSPFATSVLFSDCCELYQCCGGDIMCTEGPPATNVVYAYYLLISLAQSTLIKGLVIWSAYAQDMTWHNYLIFLGYLPCIIVILV